MTALHHKYKSAFPVNVFCLGGEKHVVSDQDTDCETFLGHFVDTPLDSSELLKTAIFSEVACCCWSLILFTFSMSNFRQIYVKFSSVCVGCGAFEHSRIVLLVLSTAESKDIWLSTLTHLLFITYLLPLHVPRLSGLWEKQTVCPGSWLLSVLTTPLFPNSQPAAHQKEYDLLGVQLPRTLNDHRLVYPS